MKTILLLLALAVAGAAYAQVDPSRPMVTGRGNVDARPAPVVISNQTSAKLIAGAADEITQLEKFQVTGSLIPVRAPAVPAKSHEAGPPAAARRRAAGDEVARRCSGPAERAAVGEIGR